MLLDVAQMNRAAGELAAQACDDALGLVAPQLGGQPSRDGYTPAPDTPQETAR
jgi:hypothetical protein